MVAASNTLTIALELADAAETHLEARTLKAAAAYLEQGQRRDALETLRSMRCTTVPRGARDMLVGLLAE
jgi:hypothetical protein